MVGEKINYMNKITLIAFFIFSLVFSKEVLADAGKAYRFFGEIYTKTEKVKGYFYVYAKDIYKEDSSVLSFCKKNYKTELKIYSKIKTLVDYPIDVSMKKYETTLNLTDVVRIVVIEYLSFIPDDRLFLLTKEEFGIIFSSKQNVDDIEFKNKNIEMLLSENCSNLLISPIKESILNDEAKKLSQRLERKINTLLKSNKKLDSDLFWQYLSLEKKKLLDKKIVLINFCFVL